MKVIRYQNPALASWPNFGGFAGLSDEIERLFETPFAALATSPPTAGWSPAFDVYESAENITVVAELPGLKKSDISISLLGERLTVSGERKVEEKLETAEVYRSERFFGPFQRSFTLPTGVQTDKITARFENGVLTVTLPKAENAKPKQIDVSVN
jgi:HSP20 family protein